MIQQIVPIGFSLIGDGSSTVFKQHINQMFGLTLNGTQLINSDLHPSGATVKNTFGIPATVAVDGGMLTITFDSAPANGKSGRIVVGLLFNGQ